MNLVNCTPHPLTLIRTDGSRLILPKGEIVPRLTQSTVDIGSIDGIRLTETVFGETTNLPEPQDNTVYIVSRLVLSANPYRQDLAVPNDLVRDENGQIIGCESLAMV